jgi:hypothetical protein
MPSELKCYNRAIKGVEFKDYLFTISKNRVRAAPPVNPREGRRVAVPNIAPSSHFLVGMARRAVHSHSDRIAA